MCEPEIKSRERKIMFTGAVLLADIIPSLCVKITLPFLVHRIPFGLRNSAVCLLQAASYLVVAFSGSTAVSLLRVASASLGAGIGELSYLGLSAHYSKHTLGSWSSGTRGAGVIGSFAYAALTEPHMIGLSPQNALLSMLIVTAIFALTYWFVPTLPPTVYRIDVFDLRTWLIPANREAADSVKVLCSDLEKTEERILPIVLQKPGQRRDTFIDRLFAIMPILRYMIPLCLVYIAEYLINQGLSQLTYFDCSHGFSLDRSSQYRWYQVLYQVGVLISRSSVLLFSLPALVLYLLPVFQFANFVLFFIDALHAFIPQIGIVFLVILVEGLSGGAAHANTFAMIHAEVRGITECGSTCLGATQFPRILPGHNDGRRHARSNNRGVPHHTHAKFHPFKDPLIYTGR